MCQSEPTTDDPAIPEQAFDLMRMGGRPDVEVLGAKAEQQIPDATPYEIRCVIVLVEAVEHSQRILIDLPARDRVFGARQ